VSAQAFFERAASRLRERYLIPDYPLAAIEVRPRALGIVRLNRSGGRRTLGAAGAIELPPGCLAPSLTQPNVLDLPAFRRVLEALLLRAGIGAGAQVGLVLPDPVARVALVPNAEIKARRQKDVLELLRFRLRKSVPFDVRESQIASVPLPPAPGRQATSIVATILNAVLDSYESAVRQVGCQPGLVELCGLALLRATLPSAAGDRLLVNWDDGYLTLILTQDGHPALIRTLPGSIAEQPAEVSREIANTVLYYRERLGGTALRDVLVRSAAHPMEEAVAAIQEATGLAPVAADAELPLSPGDRALLGHGLAGAAACVAAEAA
jgi:type IV pilus assembly protein PilM